MDEKKEEVITNYNKLQTPYVIRIENTTDEKLYKVPIFSKDKEQEGKVRYTLLNGDIGFERFLTSLTYKGFKTQKFLVYAMCDYAKFATKQLMCGMRLKNETANGSCYTQISHLTLHPMQFQSTVVDMTLEDEFNVDVLADIIFDYLMPETTVQIMIYPNEIKPKQNK